MHQRLLVIRNGTKQSTQTERLRDGTAGNLRTLSLMRDMIREDAAFDLDLRNRALQLIARCGAQDFDCEVGKLFEYAQRIRFVRDPLDVERIADAATTMAEGQGDCGDKVILLASLLGSVGHTTRAEVVNFYNDVATHGYDHVYLNVLRPDGTWQPLDPTPENVPVGWEPSAAVHTVVEFWPDTGGDVQLSGLLDEILPGLVQTGTQFAASAYQQSQLSGQQQAQLGAAFENLAGQTTALFNQIQAQPIITLADVQAVGEAYEHLAAMAQQYPTEYIVEQWNSSNYRPAYEQRLQQIANAYLAGQAGATTTQPAGSSTYLPTQGGSQQIPGAALPSIGSLTSNTLFWPLLIVIGLVGLKAFKN